MNILDEIIASKHLEVEENKSLYPIKLLERSIFFKTETVSLKKYLLDKNLSGILAEFKRKSPSKGVINAYASIENTTIGYMQSGASALSILTDANYFGGSNKDLTEARHFNYCPILRKDFIVDEYQIIEAKSIGADAILLIAAVLTKDQISTFSALAKTLGLEIILEIHEESELEKADVAAHHIGINNRNLKNFEVNFEQSIRLASQLPDSAIKIAESGINAPEDIVILKKHGFNGFLIGEHFMKESRPEKASKKFIARLQQLEQKVEHFQVK